MNKIGLKLTKISGGVQELLTVNEGDWTRKAVDIRTDINSLNGKALDDGTPVLMVSFIPTGCLLTLCRTISGRSGDLVSAWAFIPCEIAVTAEEELAVIEQLKAELAKPRAENWDELERFFAKEYPLKQMPFKYKESSSTNLNGVRYYGAGTDFELRDLLGDMLYQLYYSEHRFVFFIDKSSGITAEDKLVNYTDEPLRESIIVYPPQTPAGVTAKINANEFAKPILTLKGEKCNLTFERAGYAPFSYQVTFGKPLPDPTDLPWQKHITPSYFNVTDKDNKNLNISSRVIVNGQRLNANGINIPEADCKVVTVDVECPGYERYSNTITLLQLSPIPIVLEKEKKEIVYFIDGKECPGLTECPRGYTCHDILQGKRVNRYCTYNEENVGPKWKLIAIIGSAAALLVGLGLGILLHKIIANHSEKSKTEIVQSESEQKVNENNQDTPANTVPETVVYDCLNKDIWKKAEIDNEPDLQGFFRDVQKCNVDRLTGFWAEKIDPKKHPQWASLLIEIKKHDPILLKDFQMDNNDQEIQLQYYKKKLANWVSARGQSGKTTPAAPPSQSTSRSSNKPANSNISNPGNNSEKKRNDNNQQSQNDL